MLGSFYDRQCFNFCFIARLEKDLQKYLSAPCVTSATTLGVTADNAADSFSSKSEKLMWWCSSKVCTQAGLHYRPSSTGWNTPGVSEAFRIFYSSLRNLSLLRHSGNHWGCAALLLGSISTQEGFSPPKRSKIGEITQLLWQHKPYGDVSCGLREESSQAEVWCSGSAATGWWVEGAGEPLWDTSEPRGTPRSWLDFPGYHPVSFYELLHV